jgi:2-polyprenyl-3-methyl-5-hydroxy-6-metoxy-1,4-benzoquinol methylase
MAAAETRRDELVGRLFGAAIGAMDILSVYVGDRLGLYRALRDRGPLTSEGLAAAAGITERYAREWLEQQAATGILDLENPALGPFERTYVLPAGHDEALVEETSLNFITPFGQALVACVRPIDALLEAFRTGEGVPYADYGEDMHEGQARFTRPMFEHLLGAEWFPAAPAIHDRLLADPAARVVDVACGCGWSSISIARGYPNVRVDGIDLDEASIDKAKQNLAGSGVEDRVAFFARDAADPELAGRYDLVTVFEALHDMSRPVDVLRALRGLLADGGSVVVGDERTGDSFTAPAGDYERLLYGFSVLHCLPVGMVGEDPAGTGTVMRAETVRVYAAEAGFSEVEILPIENDFYRFYRLLP